MSLIVYVSGPYTKPDPVANTHRAIKVGSQLMTLGFVPVIPHLTMFWHVIDPMPYEDWLRYDLLLLKAMDVLLRIPGESNGADKEVAEMQRLDKPVVFGWVPDLVAWCKDRRCLPTEFPSYTRAP